MRVIPLVFCFIFIGVTSKAQVLTHKHKAKLETITDSTRRAKLLRRYLKKDSLRYQRKKVQVEQKLKGVLRDSIKALPGFEHLAEINDRDSSRGTSEAKNMGQIATERVQEELPSELSELPKDSAQLKSMALEKGRQAALNELDLEVPNVPLDSLSKESISKSLEQEAEKRFKKELEGMEVPNDLFSAEKAELEKLKQQASIDQAKQQMKSKMTNHAKEFISKHAEKIQQIQGKMDHLKRKYSSVPNSNDLSTAKKRTSLKDKSLRKRLTFGGNFNISRTNPVQLDLSPTIGYRINTLFELGATAMYRSQLEADKTGVRANNERTYGYSAYARHIVFKNFFGYLEGENINRTQTIQDQSQRTWTQNLLLGIGREFKLTSWLEFQTIVTYNFLHDNTDGVYGSAVVFKTGVRIVD